MGLHDILGIGPQAAVKLALKEALSLPGRTSLKFISFDDSFVPLF